MPLSTLANAPVKPPLWSPHRVARAAADAALPLALARTVGVDATNFRYGLARVRVTGLTSVTVRPVFWDDVSAKWTADPAFTNQTFASGSPVMGMFTFEPMGRPFLIYIYAVAGTGTVDVDVAVFGALTSGQ